ncbi:DUF1735 domain-containing protein [Pseudoflavitalea rhizosphaerae]|uniref:DUF1735 domain-containing protein n=1 Tax=Pseudoflavitalea rhizosphaerae TaxID=1884793 RepID=UPI000F8C95B8|nr:DUF1735 domain-containing protein [Pseudoflavitalea rhizosphaerae]
MKSFKIVCLSTMLAATFSSCLKDKNLDDQKYGSSGIGFLDVAYFQESDGGTSFFPGNKDTTVRLLTVTLNSKDSVAREDITITLQRRDDLVADDPDLELPPDNLFKVSSLDLVIPKGSRTGYITITGNPSNLEGHSYALGFQMLSTNKEFATIDGSQNEILVYFETRNPFDGIYKMGGNFSAVTDPLISGMFGHLVELRTTDEQSVMLFSQFAQGYYFPFLDDSDETAFGSFTPRITFDNAGKILSVVNAYGQGRRNYWGVLDPSGVNARDANGNIKLKFTINNPNLATVRFLADLELTKVSNRP